MRHRSIFESTLDRPQLPGGEAHPASTRKLHIPDCLAVVGAFGSGKTEVATNCALTIAREGRRVTLIDLDTVTPALRSRQMEQVLSSAGIELIAPSGQLAYADLPAISAGVRTAISDTSHSVIIDVGGHPNGARALGSLSDAFAAREHALWGVVSPWRPETRDPAAIRAMMDEISSRAGLPITALLANLHAPEPTAAAFRSGLAIVSEGARLLGLDIVACAVDARLADVARRALGDDRAWLSLELRMRAPWYEAGWGSEGIWHPPAANSYQRYFTRGG